MKKMMLVVLLFYSFANAQQSAPYSGASNEVTIIITHGQSLSIGVSSNTLADVSNSSEYAEAMTLDSGNSTRNSIGWQGAAVAPSAITGFTPFIQKYVWNETPASGVLSSILAGFDQQGLARPKLLSIMGGQGGRGVAELMLRNSDFYSTVSAGLAGTPDGFPFVVQDPTTKKYAFYINKAGVQVAATVGSGAATARPVYYNNILEQVKRAVVLANAQGLKLNPEIYFVWIQGQTDSNNNIYYKSLMKEMLNRMEVDLRLASGLGSQMQFHAFISQIRGIANHNRSIDHLDVVNEVPTAHIASQECWISNAFALGGPTGTHLQKIGYRVMGEQIGQSIFQFMMNRRVSMPIMTSVNVNGKVLTATFSGLRGSLVADDMVHQAMGIAIPPNFGFQIYTTTGSVATKNPIVSARILPNGYQVELTMSAVLAANSYLYLGRNQVLVDPTNSGSLYSGDTLRDSVMDPFVGASLAPQTFLGQNIPRFAPIQRVLMNKINGTYLGNTAIPLK